jgi:hypothetical protein
MQKQSKIIAVVGMIALIAGIVGATAIEQAAAQQAAINPVNPNAPTAKAYGAKTAGVVCGDRLCSEVTTKLDIQDNTSIGSISTESSDSPSAKLISIQRYTSAPYAGEAGISYKITFSVTAGDTNLRDILFHVQSDLDSFEYEVSSLNALKSSVQVIRVHAIDPDSITGELIGYSLTGPTSSGADLGPR